jgi:hypothetical protein
MACSIGSRDAPPETGPSLLGGIRNAHHNFVMQIESLRADCA